MVKLFCYAVVLFLFTPIPSFLQVKDSISQKNKELNLLKTEINKLESELKAKSQKEKESLKSLEILNEQKLLISRLIHSYRTDEELKTSEILETENQIANVENKMSQLRKVYADYVVWIYRNRVLSVWPFIFNASSFNQMLQRYKYFKLITEQNKKTLAELVASKNELSALKLQLENDIAEKERLVQQKIREQNTLTEKEAERKNLISTLKRDKKSISEEIDSKRKAEIIIKNMIAKLVEAERERRSRLAEKKATGKNTAPAYNYNKLSEFAQLKGKLVWPVKSGKIVRKFGENKNERLKTVTLNYGIDLEVKPGVTVNAVAEGFVSAIDWVPGYGSVLIITHRDEFRTVYGHVTDIKVKEGDKVDPGRALGTVNESLEGTILHFEIWSERNYQNPEQWLARK